MHDTLSDGERNNNNIQTSVISHGMHEFDSTLRTFFPKQKQFVRPSPLTPYLRSTTVSNSGATCNKVFRIKCAARAVCAVCAFVLYVSYALYVRYVLCATVCSVCAVCVVRICVACITRALCAVVCVVCDVCEVCTVCVGCAVCAVCGVCAVVCAVCAACAIQNCSFWANQTL